MRIVRVIEEHPMPQHRKSAVPGRRIGVDRSEIALGRGINMQHSEVLLVSAADGASRG